MDLKLSGRTALVTGASKGIGRAVARRLVLEGCHVHLAARTAADLEAASAALVQEAAAAGHAVQAWAHPLDLGTPGSAKALAHDCGPVEILVNNAGAIPGGNLQQVDEARWRQAWDLKVFGYVNLTREVFAGMQERGRGVIVNIIGSAGERLDADYIAGSTGNAGLMAFTRALGGTSLRHGVRVLGINPGPIATDRNVTLTRGKAQARFGDPERWRELFEPLPAARPGTPDEVAALAAFLASDLSSYTTGCIVTVDGGLSAGRSNY